MATPCCLWQIGSPFIIAEVLGLEIRLVKDPELIEKMCPRWVRRKMRKPLKAGPSQITQLCSDFKFVRATLRCVCAGGKAVAGAP